MDFDVIKQQNSIIGIYMPKCAGLELCTTC